GYGDPSQFAQYLLTIRLANHWNFSDSLRELAVDLDRKSMVVKQNALFPLAKSGSLYLSAQSEDDSSIVVIDNSIEGDCSVGFEIQGELGEVIVTRNSFIDRSSCARFYLWVSGDSAGSNEIILENNLFKGYHLNTGTYAPYSLRFTNNTFINFSQTNVFQPSSESELRISNNVFYSENIAEGLELVTLPKFASLKNNVFENSKGFWDVNEENILVAPLFADFNQGDFRFRESGVGIDAGSNGAIADIDGTDLDGNPRIVNGVVDIGAYERFTGALHPADTNGDQSISQVEFDTYNAAWRTNEAWPTLPSIIPVDFVTRAGYLLQKGGAYKNIGVGKPATWVPEDE
ncbi:MAG: right-handed parallel beta-helix repeat-containing protein, partial [Pseudomonadales bacterium]|nr:right-handed parallel beta-helix repeat-containing protein [Pseudomonadales bacterium]